MLNIAATLPAAWFRAPQRQRASSLLPRQMLPSNWPRRPPTGQHAPYPGALADPAQQQLALCNNIASVTLHNPGAAVRRHYSRQGHCSRFQMSIGAHKLRLHSISPAYSECTAYVSGVHAGAWTASLTGDSPRKMRLPLQSPCCAQDT